MAPSPTEPQKYSEQHILSQSFDETFDVLSFELLGHDNSNGVLRRVQTDADGHLQVDVLSGGGGGVQYTENDTDVSITGTAMLMEGAADTLLPVQGTVADGLLVNLGTNNDVTLTGGGGVTIKDDTAFGENVTTGILSVHNRLWDGAAYDRWPGNSTDGALVNLGANNDVTISAGSATIGAVETDGTALSNGQVTIDTTIGGVTIIAASAGRHGVDVTNQGSVACYLGTGTVSTSNGYLLNAGESIFMPTDSEIKAITASSSTTVGYLAYA